MYYLFDDELKNTPRNINILNLNFTIHTGVLRISVHRNPFKDTFVVESYILYADSGQNECMNNPDETCLEKPFYGSIIPGKYIIRRSELDHPNLFKNLARNVGVISDYAQKLSPSFPTIPGNWGNWRVRLHPDFTSDIHRDNFFLHGGHRKGSAGCIDVRGGVLGDKSSDHLLMDIFAVKGEYINVYVEK